MLPKSVAEEAVDMKPRAYALLIAGVAIAGCAWTDDGVCTLRINRDGTFSATVTAAPGASNLAKASTWSGTAVAAGDRVTLRSSQGPSTTLLRSGDRLYGVAEDPMVEVPVTISFQRERPAA
jgi:hypothetical protein